MLNHIFLTAPLGLLFACMLNAQLTPQYPQPRRSDQVDTYFGEKVSDPYRWMEDVDSPETRAWVEAENKITFAYLDAIPEREAVRRRLTSLFDYERFSAPLEVNGRIFFAHNTGLQNQSVYFYQDGPAGEFYQDGPAGEQHLFLDPNTMSKEGTVAIDGFAPNRDASLVAYAAAKAGSDWSIWKIRDLKSGQDLPDTLQWTKFTGVSWTPDGKGFYYTRYPEPMPGADLTQSNENSKVYFHRLGDDQSKDALVYERPDHPKWNFSAHVTEDGRYLLLLISDNASDDNALSYLDLKKPGSKMTPIVDRIDAAFEPLGNVDSTLYVFTNDKTPRGKIITIDLNRPQETNWRTVVPQQADAMETAILASGRLITGFLKDAHSTARAWSLDGKLLQEIPIPGLGHADWSHYMPSDKEVFFTYSEYTRPPSIYRYEVASGKLSLLRAAKLSFDPSLYEVKQEFYHGKDGARIPMFVIASKGMVRNGQNPTILYGYGGFNIPLTPAFYPRVLTWLQMGGVFVFANLRGGSEYGEEWHKAGTKLRKQNVFDDFIAAAEYLIAQKVTSTPKLAIEGRSNGGLLVGAVLNQRPDLFGAALPGVGVMDMLRFHKFTIGHAWTSDYGSSDNPEEYKAIRAYSPLHNIKKGTRYPPAFIVTADHDDRVVPGHSFKYAATMQWAQGGSAPILIRIETQAGHGGGKPVSKIIGETVDEYTFVAKVLGMKVPD